MAKPIKYCSVEGCGVRCKSKGLCGAHLWRLQTWGHVGEATIALPKHVGPRKAARPWVAAKCFKCSEEFFCSQDVAMQPRVFCSRECSDSVRDTRPKFNCAKCGKETLRTKNHRSQAYNLTQRYCSKQCGWDSQVKEGGTIHHSRYRYIKVGRKRIYEHRHVMEQMIGRKMLPHETAHHKNGIRDDNRPENLELWSTRQCKGQRIEDKVAYALEILDTYPQIASIELAKRSPPEVLAVSVEEDFDETSVYNEIKDIDGLV